MRDRNGNKLRVGDDVAFVHAETLDTLKGTLVEIVDDNIGVINYVAKGYEGDDEHFTLPGRVYSVRRLANQIVKIIRPNEIEEE